MDENGEVTVVIGYGDRLSMAVRAGAMKPMDVIEGHLHVLNPKGYTVVTLPPGQWAAAVVQEVAVAGSEEEKE